MSAEKGKNMKISAAIFDMDGTILDSMHIWEEVSVSCLRRLGAEPKPSFKEDVRMMTLAESAEYCRSEYGIEASNEAIIDYIYSSVREFYDREAALKPGAEAFLRRLHAANIPMVLATATDRPFAEAALRRLGIRELFLEVLTCSEIGAGKNRPDIFLLAAERMNAAPAETLVFEDSYPALITARDAGFLLCGVYDRMSPDRQSELAEISHIYIRDFFSAQKSFDKYI
ncbi:MAG: HAD family phosphatase [Clostridia bacterium]|nr:HAD family phosphatase [Clostridia bacterium]